MHVEPVWSKAEEKVVKSLYDILKEKFGITLVNNFLTLRFGAGCVNMVITGVEPDKMHMDGCYSCGGKTGLKPALVTITHSNGDSSEFKTKTCVDCRCPQ